MRGNQTITTGTRAGRSPQVCECAAPAFLSAPDCLALLIDPQGTIMDVRGELDLPASIIPNQVVGKKIWDYLPAEVVGRRREIIREVVRLKTASRFEDCSRGHWFEHIVHPLEGACGHITGIVILSRDITRRKLTEQELGQACEKLGLEHKALREKNIALAQVINHVHNQKRDLARNIRANLDKAIRPLLHRLEDKISGPEKNLIHLLKKRLGEIAADCLDGLARLSPGLTQREIEICTLIREGLSSREISQHLNTSVDTIKNQRKSIRKKLGIAKMKINLCAYLQNLDHEGTECPGGL